MQTKGLLRKAIGTFTRHWGAYFVLIIILDAVLNDVIVPLTDWLAQFILQLNGVPYVSYTNVSWLLTKKPLAVTELILLLFLIILLVYWQFAFLLNGIENIRQSKGDNFFVIARQSLAGMTRLRMGSFFFFSFYFLIVLPIGGVFFNSPLLSKVQIPDFIQAFISTRLSLTIILVALYLSLVALALRFIQVLPLMILQQKSGSEAIRQSWRVTRHHSWSYLWRSLLLISASILTSALLSLALYGSQLYFDTQSHAVALSTAVGSMGLLRLWTRFVGDGTLVIFVIMLVLATTNSGQNTPISQIQIRTKYWPRWLTVVLAILYLGAEVTYDVNYLKGAFLTEPLTISHRGVDNKNGVQNTIPVLAKTAKEKPDYVEMDIRETKDHQFVVMHDTNLKALAGINRAPYQLTLKQLQAITIHENGYTAKIASFDAYLTAAEKNHQKLLIEIKTSSHDSQNMLSLFIQRYEKRLLRDKDRIHSLDYNVVAGLKQQAPKLFVSYILPYNFTFPQTKANAYTMEETTLNAAFVTKAHAHHQRVYAWTVNETGDIAHMLFLNVDGIITDNLTELQQTIRTNFRHPSYAQRLLIYATDLQNISNSSGMTQN